MPKVEMSPEVHVSLLNEAFAEYNTKRYLQGRKEHMDKGDPALYDWSIPNLVDAALEEAVDQVNYLLTLRAKLRAAKRDAE